MTEHVNITLDAGVLILTLDRPEKKNALSEAMYRALTQALARAQADPDIRVVLIQGAGGVFTAGNDLADFAAFSARDDATPTAGEQFVQALGRVEKPLVAAVVGAAVGIGTTLLLHCDLVYVADDARLSTPFVNLALAPEAASSLLLPARIGHVRAFAMFALGEVILGERAAELGLANQALPAADVQPAALAAAKALAARPLGAVIATKRLMRAGEAVAERTAAELDIFKQRLRTPEAAEAFAAFTEHRAPNFAKAPS